MAHVFTFTEIFISSNSSSYCLVSFHFNMQLLQHFWRGGSNNNEQLQLLFIWECLRFSLCLNDSFAKYRISSLNIYQPVVFGPLKFLMRNLLLILLWILVCDKLLLSWTVIRLIIMSLDVGLFEFILLSLHWTAWIFVFMSFMTFGKLSAVISSNILSAPFSLLLGPSQCICLSI